MCVTFLFKTGGVCDHLKFTWMTVSLCWTAERENTFAKFCVAECINEEWDFGIRQSERSGHQQRLLQAFTDDVFIFSLLVYIAH